MDFCGCFGACGCAGDVSAQPAVGRAVAVACGSEFPAVRPARTAHGMDAQRAVCRRPGRYFSCRSESRSAFSAALAALRSAFAFIFSGFRTRTGRPDRTVPEDRAVLPDHTVPADRTEPAGRKSLLAKVALGIAFFVLAAMLAYDISTEGIAVGVTKAVGFGLLILLAAVGYRLGYLKL